MPHDEVMSHGLHVMTVCNSCRYCEQYCPVFQAMETRTRFLPHDITYLANLCHNCGECLYACQYAPPHEFGIDVPRAFAEVRLRSYEQYCWPRPLGAAFRRHGVATSLLLTLVVSVVIFALVALTGIDRLWPHDGAADFYGVVPHGVMVGVFGSVSAFVLVALLVGVVRFWRDQGDEPATWMQWAVISHALRDIATLRHLHSDGIDCVSREEVRTPWRRWFHHCTVYGFALCFLSTSIAAMYHSVFGWQAPYGYTSLPVVAGTLGGLGLLVGPAGLLALKFKRDPALGDPGQRGLDEAFLTMLFFTSLTGLLLLVLRETQVMGVLLVVHLAFVLVFFLTMPYGKFVHGFYRAAALFKFAVEHAPGVKVPDVAAPMA
jgi:citrate/tricarballylate utilization protein